MNRIPNVLKIAITALCFGVLVASATPASAQSAKIELHIGKAGFIIGASGGHGTLYYEGAAIPLTIGGVSIGLTIGISSADLRGNVYNLTVPADIAGTYSRADSSLAVGVGGAGWVLQNGKGVRIEVSGAQVGFDASLELGGMTISVK